MGKAVGLYIQCKMGVEDKIRQNWGVDNLGVLYLCS